MFSPSMFKARFTLMFVLIAALMVVAQPRCTWACSCIAPGTPEEERERAVAVFSGRVENIQPQAGGVAGQVRVTLAVSDVWKGDAPATTVVETTSDSASCGPRTFARAVPPSANWSCKPSRPPWTATTGTSPAPPKNWGSA